MPDIKVIHWQFIKPYVALKTITFLLESAEIDKKHQLKSLLVTDAALKIVCHGHQVAMTALTVNGKAALALAKAQFS